MKVRNTAGDEFDIAPNAYLFDADLTQVDLANADLSGADLRGAILRGANLTGAVLSGVSYDPKRTLWPDGFSPPPNTPH